jgi:hypothetical protein
MNDLKKHLNIPKWLFVLLIVIFVLRIPSLFEPYSYGDEMIYLTLGEGVRQGVTLYSDLHDNKPPLLYFTAALAGNLFWFKSLLALWNLASIVLFWKLTEILLKKKYKSQRLATILFAIFTTLPLFEGNIANAEIFMVGFTLIGILLALRDKLTPFTIIGSGICISLAALFKIPAAFDALAILFLWATSVNILKRKDFVLIVKRYALFTLGFGIPFIAVLAWYASRGALSDYVAAALMQNVGYLSSWRPDDVQKSFVERNAPLITRGLVMLTGLLILFVKRKSLSSTFIVTSAWVLSSTFAATLSERPYPHYMIQVVPSVAILFAMLIYNKTKEQVYVFFPLLIAVLAPFYYKFWYYPSVPYYKSFIQYATGGSTQAQYFDTFNTRVNRNYKIAKIVATNTKQTDTVFVWEDSPTIYALSKRLPPIKFAAGYHINEFADKKDILDQIIANKPVMIVTMPEAIPFEGLEFVLSRHYAIADTVDGAKIWRRISTPELKENSSK